MVFGRNAVPSKNQGGHPTSAPELRHYTLVESIQTVTAQHWCFGPRVGSNAHTQICTMSYCRVFLVGRPAAFTFGLLISRWVSARVVVGERGMADENKGDLSGRWILSIQKNLPQIIIIISPSVPCFLMDSSDV